MKIRIIQEIDIDLATLPYEQWPEQCKRVAVNLPDWIKRVIAKAPESERQAKLAQFVQAALTPLTVKDL